jgi:lysophospholipase L1-like esterase
MKNLAVFLLLFSICACKTTQTSEIAATNKAINMHGRAMVNEEGNIELISSGAFVEFQFMGDSCIISLQNSTAPNDYNYVAIEIDQEYKGRLKVTRKEVTPFVIKATKANKWHQLRLFKATEAANGIVTFVSVKALQVKANDRQYVKKIEFIGNSITCGMGNDAQEIPCGNGSKWYDQHNAYWSYASQVARELGTDYTLNAISGAGIYRNWNSETPTVPQQYDNAYLNTDNTHLWKFDTAPDVVSIALGTNDLSRGDGKTPRAAFNATTFINEYVKFIEKIYQHYPKVQIVLLTSPMITGNNAEILKQALERVRSKVGEKMPTKRPIQIFQFTAIKATGCTGHPTIAEHTQMKTQLLPFFKAIIAQQ